MLMSHLSLQFLELSIPIVTKSFYLKWTFILPASVVYGQKLGGLQNTMTGQTSKVYELRSVRSTEGHYSNFCSASVIHQLDEPNLS